MTTLKVMTFNIRQMDGDDGPHAWQFRRDVLVETIRLMQPDLVGTQETFADQAAYITERLPEYAWFGRGRYGDARDKHCGVFYRKDLFQVMRTGEVWISETPEEPGSCSWGIERPRMVTWGELACGRERLFVINAHFPYRATQEEARLHTVRLILELVERTCNAMPVLLTADANSPAGGNVHRLLTEVLHDAWEMAAERHGPCGTVHGFGAYADDRRIDWILYRAPWRVMRAETVPYTRGGLYPSDHYPVQCAFEVPVD